MQGSQRFGVWGVVWGFVFWCFFFVGCFFVFWVWGFFVVFFGFFLKKKSCVLAFLLCWREKRCRRVVHRFAQTHMVGSSLQPSITHVAEWNCYAVLLEEQFLRFQFSKVQYKVTLASAAATQLP